MTRRSSIGCALGDREYVFTGAARGKAGFTVAALKAARRSAKLVLAVHPNFAPLVRSMNVFAPQMKSIICAHGIEVWEPLSRLRRRSLQQATMVLAPSRATADYVVSMQGVAPERVRVLPWGLDPDFETRVSVDSAAFLPAEFPNGRVILTVGRWLATERYKGMDTLIQGSAPPVAALARCSIGDGGSRGRPRVVGEYRTR